MGSCLSKKSTTCSTSPTIVANVPHPPPDLKLKAKVMEEEEKKIPQPPEEGVKKEIFVIKQSRRSHDRRSESPILSSSPIQLESASPTTSALNVVSPVIGTAPVRTSSCTKEEVDAILIQCGRLSRSSSGKASGDTKYSGSKRSYDFDHENHDVNYSNNDDDVENYNEQHHGHRHHSRHSHRRTPSREKDGGGVGEHKRSGSREREERRNRSNGGGSRRVSRSPGRRSETPTPPSATAPSKMVAVPARDKSSSIPESTTTTGIKRVSVKRSGDVGGGRTSASPTSHSPANVTRGGSIENVLHHPQQQSLSRNSSRKAEHSRSPYRRNPMNEIDDNCLKSNTVKSQDQTNKVQRTKETDQERTKKHIQKKPDERSNKVTKDVNNIKSVEEIKEEQTVEEPIKVKGVTSKLGEVVISNRVENSIPQTITTRTRSSRRSRDLDINIGSNPDNILNPTSYASLLLEDIQNFHHQNTTAFSLPPCVTKACSILDAVADLNSSTSHNISSDLSESEEAASKNNTSNSSNVLSIAAKKRLEVKDSMVEAEVEAFINDDVMEPESHLHKYITVRKRGEESEQQESSGSNSFAGQHWVSSSSWEPNSADSTDRWTSRSNTREESYDGARDVDVGAGEMKSGNGTQMPASCTASGKKRELNHGQHHQQHQMGARGHRSTMPNAAAAALL